jgi:hypothetical protein
VVQCLTELGLNVKRARISSDGGWFVDEFHVTETAGPMQQVSSSAVHLAWWHRHRPACRKLCLTSSCTATCLAAV